MPAALALALSLLLAEAGRGACVTSADCVSPKVCARDACVSPDAPVAPVLVPPLAPAPPPAPEGAEDETFPVPVADLALYGAAAFNPDWPTPHVYGALAGHAQVGARLSRWLGVVGFATVTQTSLKTVGTQLTTLGAGLRIGRASHLTVGLGGTYYSWAAAVASPLPYEGPLGAWGGAALMDLCWVVLNRFTVHAQLSAATDLHSVITSGGLGVGFSLF